MTKTFAHIYLTVVVVLCVALLLISILALIGGSLHPGLIGLAWAVVFPLFNFLCLKSSKVI